MTWLILFGYSFSTHPRARRAKRSAAAVSNFGGASAAVTARGNRSRSAERKDFMALLNREHRNLDRHRRRGVAQFRTERDRFPSAAEIKPIKLPVQVGPREVDHHGGGVDPNAEEDHADDGERHAGHDEKKRS